MIIEITPPGSDGREFVIIELQGELQVRRGERLDGQTLGTLRFESGKPTMVIGNQKAEGKVESLPKPQAVMMRESVVSPPSSSAAPAAPGAWSIGGAASPVCMRIVGMARQRIVFRSRPQPIISSLA